MTSPRYLINGVTCESLGLANPQLQLSNWQADTLSLTHATASWDADPLFAYNAALSLTLDGVCIFRGRRRLAPRFAGAEAESLTYEFAGPFDWLAGRTLLQNTAIVVDPDTSTIPTLLPQGLIILGQSDAGTSVNLAQALTTVITAAIAAGVPIALGVIEGFDHGIEWDEVADLNYADALLRLLKYAPDAVVSWDYAPAFPVISLRRRAALPALTLAVAPKGQGGDATYVPFESLKLTDRPDLQMRGVFLTYRRQDTINGRQYLRLSQDTAKLAPEITAQDENVLVRTLTLAGSSYTANTLTQDVKVVRLSVYLTAAGTITPAQGDAFAALSRFWKRKVGWLTQPGVTITGFRACARAATDTGEDPAPILDLTLANELIEGAITDWMEASALNITGQDQTFTCEIATTRTVGGELIDRQEPLTAGVLATNATSRTYQWTESADYVPAERPPEGMAATLLAALSPLVYDGTFQLVQDTCELTIKPGVSINLSGARAEYQTMGALVQSVAAELNEGRTMITVGWPKPLGPDDLIQVGRANRFKKGADTGLMRTKGVF
jgi:hypothetical protein